MSKTKHNFSMAQVAFIEALSRYQAASLKKSQALKRMTEYAHDYCHALHAVVEKTSVMTGAQHR